MYYCSITKDSKSRKFCDQLSLEWWSMRPLLIDDQHWIMVVLPLSPLSSYIAVESMNMMNSGKVWEKMVWPSSHLQQLRKFCEKWSRQLESWDELFKWVSDNIGFLLNRNLRYRTNILSFSCQLNDFTTYVIAFQYSSALRILCGILVSIFWFFFPFSATFFSFLVRLVPHVLFLFFFSLNVLHL